MKSWYSVNVDMDEDTFMVTSPDFPEVTTFGDDLEFALRNGREAIEEAMAGRITDNLEISPPCDGEGKRYHVQLSALTFLKAALYMLCRAKEVSRAELSRRLGWHREQVDRLFRLDHKSQLDQLEAAFEAIGIQLASALDLSPRKAA